MNREHIYRALSKIAWGYILLHLNLNLGTLNILPNWAGYLLIGQAIALLGQEIRELPLLKPFCILLGMWEGAAWCCAILGVTLEGRFFLWDLVVTVVALYFHFQLLTDLSRLADRTCQMHHEANPQLGVFLRRCRNIDAVLRTAFFILSLWGAETTVSTALAVLLLAIWALVTLFILYYLFTLHKYFRAEDRDEL